jgi:hypothetical protein
VAYQKFNPEFFFKAFDLLTERRLCDAQHFSGARKIAAFCYLHKVFELTQIHLAFVPDPNICGGAAATVNVLSKCAFGKTIA